MPAMPHATTRPTVDALHATTRAHRHQGRTSGFSRLWTTHLLHFGHFPVNRPRTRHRTRADHVAPAQQTTSCRRTENSRFEPAEPRRTSCTFVRRLRPDVSLCSCHARFQRAQPTFSMPTMRGRGGVLRAWPAPGVVLASVPTRGLRDAPRSPRKRSPCRGGRA